jgi:phosphonate transport system substrate-binding protein
MRKMTKAQLVVGFSRPDYFSGVIVMADSPYQVTTDLKGQKVAVGSVGSTSNHLGPMQVMADLGLNPLKDISVINTDRKIAFEALKKGDIAGVGMNFGKFIGLREKEFKGGGLPPGAFRVIGRGRDLPNDVLLVAPHVDAAVISSVKEAFTSHSDDLISAILKGEDNQKYKGMKFLPTIDDKDYNYVRSMYKTIGYPEYAEFVGD